jgi:hypothetical protein
MLPNTRKEIANKLNDLYKSTLDSVLVPIITNTGILVGAYMIKHQDGFFIVTRKGKKLYKTYSKSSALIIAGLLNKKEKSAEIANVLEIDRLANALRNDLILFKHHREIAVKNNNFTKEQIMLARFEVTNEKYSDLKEKLKKSYSRLF